MTYDEAVDGEIKAILTDPAFQRAPVQSRLLSYLAEKTRDESRGKLTQYDIAVEALGRPQDFDETTDSYVRVQMSRLRATLADYYSRNEPNSSGCIYLRAGDYALHIGSRSVAYPGLLAQARESGDEGTDCHDIPDYRPPVSIREHEKAGAGLRRLARRGVTLICAALLIAVIALAGHRFVVSGEMAQAARPAIERPYLGYEIAAVGFAKGDQDFAVLESAATASIEASISQSITSHLHEVGDDRTPNYLVKVLFDVDTAGTRYADLQLKDGEQRVIHQRRRMIPHTPHIAIDMIRGDIVDLVAPSGALAHHIAGKIARDPRNGFECLILIEVAAGEGRQDEGALESCRTAYSDSEFSPFWEARRLLWQFQDEIALTGKLTKDSEHWLRLGELLRQYPANLYLNAVAAKVLLGREECRAASPILERLRGQRSAFPAMELMLATEAGGCEMPVDGKAHLQRRVLELARGDREANAVFELYRLTALLVLDQSEVIESLPPHPFVQSDNESVTTLIEQLRSAAENQKAMPAGSGIERMVWNKKARQKLLHTDHQD